MVHCQIHRALTRVVDQGTLSALLIPCGATIKMARNSNFIWGQLLKWWVSPTTMGFPTKNDQHLGCEMGGKPTIYGNTHIVPCKSHKDEDETSKIGPSLKRKELFHSHDVKKGRVLGVERKLQNWRSKRLLFKQENRRRWEQIGNKHVERKFIGSWRPGLKLKRNTGIPPSKNPKH